MSYGFATQDGPELDDLSVRELEQHFEANDVEHVRLHTFYAWNHTPERGWEFIPFV